MTETLVLDAVQRQVVSAPVESRQIVVAGPGAGKSQVVGERCRHLLTEDVYPEEILVISFSNAAVGVVRERTSDVVDQGRGVDCTTIDSLAARIRADLEHGEPVFRGYDDSVVRATHLLSESPERVLADLRHVIIDEVQDVVGVRALFVLALLNHALGEDVGFTLLGDPMQSLYDFQLDDVDLWTSEALLSAIEKHHFAKIIVLQGEYRSRTPDARAVAMARQSVEVLTPPNQLLRMRGIANDLPPFGNLDEDAAQDIAAWDGTTALLCDSNARVGLVADKLASFGLPVELAPRATEQSLAPWISDLLAGHHSSALNFEQFLRLAEEMQLENAESRWRSLIRVAQSPHGVDLHDLSAGLRSRRHTAPLVRLPATRVLASTVHRAKGLEFDNVVLVDQESWFEDPINAGASARRLFVAMSRARARVTLGRGVSAKFWHKDARHGVWLRRSPNGRGTLGLLLEPGYARALGPALHDLSQSVGTKVSWHRVEDLMTTDGDMVPSWTAQVDGMNVGKTGEEFGVLLRRLSFNGRLPRLTGGRVEGLETVVGSPDLHEQAQHGFWTGSRISGPVSFEWE